MNLTPRELHEVWTAAAARLADILTGEIEICAGRDECVESLSTAVEKLTRAMNGAPDPAVLKLQTIEKLMRDHAAATGDWSLASPVLEIIGGDF